MFIHEVYSITPQEDQLGPIAIVGFALKFLRMLPPPAGIWEMMRREKMCHEQMAKRPYQLGRILLYR